MDVASMNSSWTDLSADSNPETNSTSDKNPQPIYCIDHSGSTDGVVKYWTSVSAILQPAPDDARVIFWDTSAKEVPLEGARLIASAIKGYGGTEPVCFARVLPDETKSPLLSLIIVTDGQVSPWDVKRCDDLLNGREFLKVGKLRTKSQSMSLKWIFLNLIILSRKIQNKNDTRFKENMFPIKHRIFKFFLNKHHYL
jgi:hypothetical protein